MQLVKCPVDQHRCCQSIHVISLTNLDTSQKIIHLQILNNTGAILCRQACIEDIDESCFATVERANYKNITFSFLDNNIDSVLFYQEWKHGFADCMIFHNVSSVYL